jgi:hypothetical protein
MAAWNSRPPTAATTMKKADSVSSRGKKRNTQTAAPTAPAR